jgi:mannose-6-phosphate isomerase-like protein (cupin superfamily)
MDFADGKSVRNQSFTLSNVGTFTGKYFLKNNLGLTGMEVSMNILPAGAAVPFKHRHKKHEELYFIIKGEGEFDIDDECLPIKEGSMIRVAPNGIRTWRNTGKDDLYYMVIQAQAGSMAIETVEDGELVS